MVKTRGLFAASLCLCLTGAVVAQNAKDAKPAFDKDKIVGSWVLVKGPDLPAGSLIEFTKDSKVLFKITDKGKTREVSNTFKIDGDKLLMISTRDKITETFTIKTLNDEKLILSDEFGTDEYKRAAKKDPAPK